METKRFQATRRGKDWIVTDTATGEIVAAFHSRKGLPASSLAIRAMSRTKDWNESIERLGEVQIGMKVYS